MRLGPSTQDGCTLSDIHYMQWWDMHVMSGATCAACARWHAAIYQACCRPVATAAMMG